MGDSGGEALVEMVEPEREAFGGTLAERRLVGHGLRRVKSGHRCMVKDKVVYTCILSVLQVLAKRCGMCVL